MKKKDLYSERRGDIDFRIFHELMLQRVQEILLVSSPYDAFILEEDGSVASRIIHEYKGLNLSKPPRLTQISKGSAALSLLRKNKYDLVITTPFVSDMDALSLGEKIKRYNRAQRVILLTSSLQQVRYNPDVLEKRGIDDLFLWSGSTDLFLAIIKNYEDHLNVSHDTSTAMVRVLLFVEDSPVFRSFILPSLYKIVVRQTQSVLDESLNEEHRLLKMRARPKILTASSFEDAVEIYNRHRDYISGVVSDTKYFKEGTLNSNAGYELLKYIRSESRDIPLLLLSSNPGNRERGEKLPAVFYDKNDPGLLQKIESFFLNHLGFGDFVFRMPDGREVGRAENLRSFERKLAVIPEQSLAYHARQNHFSTWIMARSEISLASWFHQLKVDDFASIEEMRGYLCKNIHELEKRRQKGVIATFVREEYNPEIMDFVKIGKGSMGGKARGLAFMNYLLCKNRDIAARYPGVSIRIPKTCVVSEEAYKAFIEANKLYYVCGGSDAVVEKRFCEAKLPAWLCEDLRAFLLKVDSPLAVRSSSLLEDSIFRPYAGLYRTFMLPNIHHDIETRLLQLELAVKRVFASSYYEGPRSFSKKTGQNRTDSMAVILQELTGKRYGNFFYPAISGVAQSYNYYPVGGMKPEDGLVHIAVGFGKIVVEGEQAVQFSPRKPDVIPQFSSVEEILRCSQRHFYALDIASSKLSTHNSDAFRLARRDVSEATGEFPLQMLTSTYIPEENRVRDMQREGPKVVTFSRLLKHEHNIFADIIHDFLELGKSGIGCDVEIEFSADMNQSNIPSEFSLLQIRPMVVGGKDRDVEISQSERKRSFCLSKKALGAGRKIEIKDIVFVNPEIFSTLSSRETAQEIGQINAMISKAEGKYLLIGPGRWGSADGLLGVPVKWQDISAVAAIIELRSDKLNAEPSQGSHFFQNITSLEIPYLTIQENSVQDKIDWLFLQNLPVVNRTKSVVHCAVKSPFTLKIDGKKSEAAAFVPF